MGIGTCKACPDMPDELLRMFASVQKTKPRWARECPLDSDQLGQTSWAFLHTIAAYYPETPSAAEQKAMTSFMQGFAMFYPCKVCVPHLVKEMKHNPVATESQSALSLWFCNLHNSVNERLGKPIFNCAEVDERWLTGYSPECDAEE